MENTKGIINLIIKYIQIDVVKVVIGMTSTTKKIKCIFLSNWLVMCQFVIFLKHHSKIINPFSIKSN